MRTLGVKNMLYAEQLCLVLMMTKKLKQNHKDHQAKFKYELNEKTKGFWRSCKRIKS